MLQSATHLGLVKTRDRRMVGGDRYQATFSCTTGGKAEVTEIKTTRFWVWGTESWSTAYHDARPGSSSNVEALRRMDAASMNYFGPTPIDKPR